jgi:hypothetical protein
MYIDMVSFKGLIRKNEKHFDNQTFGIIRIYIRV